MTEHQYEPETVPVDTARTWRIQFFDHTAKTRIEWTFHNADQAIRIARSIHGIIAVGAPVSAFSFDYRHEAIAASHWVECGL